MTVVDILTTSTSTKSKRPASGCQRHDNVLQSGHSAETRREVWNHMVGDLVSHFLKINCITL